MPPDFLDGIGAEGEKTRFQTVPLEWMRKQAVKRMKTVQMVSGSHMKLSRIFFLSFTILSGLQTAHAQQHIERTSICAIQNKAPSFLHSNIEVHAFVFVAFEASHIEEGGCSFRFAFGDDYQTFGNRFRVVHDAQWALMKKFLNEHPDCSVDAKVIKARIRGTVIHLPTTGTITEKEMPLEIIIQSVSEVVRVPTKCPPRETTPRRVAHRCPAFS